MLRLLAMLIMTIDHVGAYFVRWIPYDIVRLLRTIGRLAFPCFVYMLALGYRRTSNIFKYFGRLTLFAIISQIAMNLMADYTGYSTYVNVFFTLSLSLALIAGFDLFWKSSRDLMLNLRPSEALEPYCDEAAKPNFFTIRYSPGGITLPAWLGVLSGGLLFAFALFACDLLEPDYSFYGLTLALAYHVAFEFTEPLKKTLRADLKIKHNLIFLFVTFVVTQLVMFLGKHHILFYKPMASSQIYASLAPLLFFLEPYGGKPSRPMRFIYYAYYPAHLCLFMYLRYILAR